MRVESRLPAAYARVVVDTNVLLSAALIPGGAPALLVDRLLAEALLVFSAATFDELETRIWKPKFDRYLSMDRRRALLHDFKAAALWVQVPEEIAARALSRDRSDDAFIHAAWAAEATRLVSGDVDLLDLHPLGEPHILSPGAALDEIATQA